MSLEQRMIACRIGWVVAPGDLVNDVSRAHIYNGLVASGFGPVGARVALEAPDNDLAATKPAVHSIATRHAYQLVGRRTSPPPPDGANGDPRGQAMPRHRGMQTRHHGRGLGRRRAGERQKPTRQEHGQPRRPLGHGPPVFVDGR